MGLESTKCDYIETCGKYGYRILAILYIGIIITNVSFSIGLVWALFIKYNLGGQFNNDAMANHLKEQKRILVKILGIFVLFLFTYLPGIVMSIIMGFDFNGRKYITPIMAAGLLTRSNSLLSPLVYVWRYPECRYSS